MPFWQFFRKADMALFNPCMKINFFWPNVFIWSGKQVHYKKISWSASGSVQVLIQVDNRIISKSVHAISKIILILGSYKFLACLECISRNGLSFFHSDWDPSSAWIQQPNPNHMIRILCFGLFFQIGKNKLAVAGLKRPTPFQFNK